MSKTHMELDTLEACELLDCNIFSGEQFYNKKALKEFKIYLERWQRGISEIEETLKK